MGDQDSNFVFSCSDECSGVFQPFIPLTAGVRTYVSQRQLGVYILLSNFRAPDFAVWEASTANVSAPSAWTPLLPANPKYHFEQVLWAPCIGL